MLFLPVTAVLALLVVVNLLNNRWLEGWYVRTCLVSAVLLVLLGRLDQLSWYQMGLSPARIIPGVIWGAAAVGAVLLVYTVGLALPFTRRFFLDERAGEQSGVELLKNALVVVPFGTVLLEEIAFRGVLLGMIETRFGLWPAILVSSVVFGLWHILPSLVMHESNAGVGEVLGEGLFGRAMAVVLSVLGTAGAGVVFCVLVWGVPGLFSGSQSLIAPMALHWALNGLGFVFTWGVYRRRRARSPFTPG